MIETAVGGARPAEGARPYPSFGEALRVWLRVAMLSFGGPAGQIAVMHRIIVEEQRWVSESRFLHALNFCMLLPGPEAQQLATYVGWLMHRTLGGILAGSLFILPGVVAIMGLSYVYAAYGHVGLVTALFLGLKAAVLAIVVHAVLRIGGRALTNRFMMAVAALSFLGIFCLRIPFPAIVLAAGFTGFIGGRFGWRLFQPTASDHEAGRSAGAGETILGEDLPTHARPSPVRALVMATVWLLLWLAPVAAILLTLGPNSVYGQIAVFFSKMALVTFGGAYAVLAYVAQQAVDAHGWLAPGEMLDGLGMAETTPGPLIMVVQFVGFMAAWRQPGPLAPALAGTLGGLLTTWVTFTPCFLWIFLFAPFVEAMRGNRALSGALSVITAAVVGVILNLAVWFAIHTMFHQSFTIGFLGRQVELPVLASVDVWAFALAGAALVAVFRYRVGTLPLLAAAAAAGPLLRLAGAPP